LLLFVVVDAMGAYLHGDAAVPLATTCTSATSSFSSITSPAHPHPGMNASTYLIRQALIHASENVIGRRAARTENLSWILSLPQSGVRRRVHDDITVVVVFFQDVGTVSASHPTHTFNHTFPGPTIPHHLRRALNSTVNTSVDTHIIKSKL
jgi:hypothetical protein